MNYWPGTWQPEELSFAFSGDGADADFVLFFGACDLIAQPSVFESLRRHCPKARIVGCSTGTAISGNRLGDTLVSAVAVKLDRSRVELVTTDLVGRSSYEAGASIGAQLPSANLAGVLVFSDGLAVNGTCLVAGMQSVLGATIPISGGLAGDGAAFSQTLVGADAIPREKLIAALGFYGNDVRIGSGAAHGWDLFGPAREVTNSVGSVLYEMDGKPALDLYERYLGDEAADLPASGLLYPLLLTNPEDTRDEVVRTILAIDRDKRTLTFAGDVPRGWSARLMRGNFENLTRGAGTAAEIAGRSLIPAEASLAILISCVGRRLLMKQRTADEIEATAAALTNRVHQIGFYSYGEIATAGVTGHCGFHNQTMTVMTIQEAA